MTYSNQNENIILISQQLKSTCNESIKMASLLTPIIEANKKSMQQLSDTINDSIRSMVEPLCIKASSLSSMALSQYSESILTISSLITENLNKSINKDIGSIKFDFESLMPCINFASSTAHNISELKECESELELIDTYVNVPSENAKKKISYYDLIMLILGLITVIYTVMGYYKPEQYEKETLDALTNLNYNLEQIIELESTK